MAYGENDLVMTADEPFTKTFQRLVGGIPQSWAGRTTRLQMRTPYGNQLLIELTAFLSIDAVDATKLNLSIPGTFTGKLAPEGVWDLLSVSNTDSSNAFRLPSRRGRILVLQGVTVRA